MGKTMTLQIERMITFDGKGTLKAFCDLSIDGTFLIRGVRVVEGKQGLFVSMPRQQGKDSKWYDIVRAMTREAKEEMTRVVLAAYQHDAASHVEEEATLTP